jgi:hypothetical protein
MISEITAEWFSVTLKVNPSIRNTYERRKGSNYET